MKYKTYLLLLFLFGISGCAKGIYQQSEKNYKKKVKTFQKEALEIPPLQLGTKKVQVIESQNFSFRKPTFVVIHHTNQKSCEQTYRTFALAEPEVSAHYVICKDGTITQMLHDYLRGWHAGNGSWKGITDLNSVSLGIELDNNGFEPFPNDQIESLMVLLQHLHETYDIPAENFIGHADLAPGRKVDPSYYFPWEQLATNGYGVWYDEDKLSTLVVPDWFNAEHGLRIIGYNTKNLNSAIQSFQLHFNPRKANVELNEGGDKEVQLSEKDIKIIWLLSR